MKTNNEMENNKVVEVERDERTDFVTNRYLSISATIMTFALLLDCIYRIVRFGKWEWDIMLIITISVLFPYFYYGRTHKTLEKSYRQQIFLWLFVGMVIGAVLVLLSKE